MERKAAVIAVDQAYQHVHQELAAAVQQAAQVAQAVLCMAVAQQWQLPVLSLIPSVDRHYAYLCPAPASLLPGPP